MSRFRVTELVLRTEKLEAQNALMREALQAVEWVPVEWNPSDRECPWCEYLVSERGGKHAPDCLRQRALIDVDAQYADGEVETFDNMDDFIDSLGEADE